MMFRHTASRVVIVSTIICSLLGFTVQVGEATQYKVLVVMSYSETWEWVQEINEGIESVLADNSELHYVYMDTRKNYEGGPEKAKEAYTLYQELQPDGVIAADDNAQSMFVVPYLKDKVDTPVIFCGVNTEPEAYGYPASNVTGILERVHFKESIAFVQQLVPSIKTIGYIMKASPTADNYFQQFQGESETYSAESVVFKLPNTLAETVAMLEELKPQVDVLFLEGMEGLPKEDGTPLTDKEILPKLAEMWGKPTICANEYTVGYGILCAMIKTGQEQGSTAAKMLLQAMQGTPVSEIPITRNKHGRRVINVTTMTKLGITPKPEVLRGTKLIKTK